MALNKVVVEKYLNSHLFYIRDAQDLTNLTLIEKILQHTSKELVQIQANLDQLVALFDNTHVRRGIVVKSFPGGYYCWLLDYANYVTTDKVFQLPEELHLIPPTIKIASLNNLVGLHHQLNVETLKDEMECLPYFHSHAVEYIEKKLSKAKYVYFCEERKVGEILCGNFVLQMMDGVHFNLADLLVNEGLARLDRKLFLEALELNIPKIPIVTTSEEESKVCFTEGIGRGRQRLAANSNKNRQIDAWLEKIEDTPSQCGQFTDKEDSVKDEDFSLNSNYYISDNNNSEPSQMMVSDSSLSLNTTFSDSSLTSDTSKGIKKLRGRGKLLRNESFGCVNKKDIGDGEKCVKNNLESLEKKEVEIKENKNDSDKSGGLKKEMKRSELVKMLINLSKKPKLTDTSDVSTSTESSSSSFKNKIITEPTNIESSSDSSSIVTNQQIEPIEVENCRILKPTRLKNSIICKCKNCIKLLDDDIDDNPKTFTDEIKQVDNFIKGKPQLLLKAETSTSEIKMIKKINDQTKIEKNMSPNLLIHSPGQLPVPIKDIFSVPFCDPVHKALKTINYKSPRTMQMYIWPVLMRSMNACIINNHSTGKTMCYLPALCSFLIQKDDRYPCLPKEPSPITIILVDSIKHAEDIFNFLCSFLSNTSKRVEIALLVPPTEDSFLKCLKKADLIVSTPTMLARILTSRIINLKRLCHLVIENIDKILDHTSKEFYKIIRSAQSMLEHRNFINSVQIVMTSEKWTIPLESFIRSMETPPVICIGSHLESVIYAKANIEMHFIKKEEKKKRIVAMLKEYSTDLKTVIICNTDEEVVELGEYFQILGISVYSATRDLLKEDIGPMEDLWLCTPMKKNSVFICTDYVLHSLLSITTAQVLIHYSLPGDSWSLFTRRFKAVIDTHDSPFNKKFNRSEAVKVHIFVDESCSKQFPRLYYFLKEMKTNLPENFKQFCQEVEEAEELIKIEENIPICKRLKLLGECNKFRCKKRHLFSSKIDTLEYVPNSGIIKFKMLNVADVTQFGIKILEWWGTNRNKQNLTDYTNLVTKELRKCVNSNKVMVTDVKIGSLYVYFDAKEVTYHRCVVLKILSRQQITNAAHEIKIKLIDDGIEKRAFASLLFELSPEYLEIPPQSLEARLANIVPLERDTEWNLRSKYKVEKMINELLVKYPKAYFVGKILLQVGETIWLEDLLMREDISSLKETVTLLTLKKKLIGFDIVDSSESPLNNLREICLKSGLDLPCYDIEDVPKPKFKHIEQIVPQWAFLDQQPDVYNVVYFSHAVSPEKFYVKLEKYYDLYLDLEGEIQSALEKAFYPLVEEVLPGHCYLAKDPVENIYNRVLVTDINDEIATCFFVDFGDVIDVPKDELKYLSNEHISKLPFQAIECELYGVKPITDTWQPEALNVFYKYSYRPNTDIFRDLFVNVVDSKPSKHNQKYSVALLDYYDNKKTAINKILIDCGLAIDDETAKFEDLVLPEFSIYSDPENDNEYEESSSDDEKNRRLVPNDDDMKKIIAHLPDKVDDVEDMYEDIDRSVYETEGFDFFCTDFKTFMDELMKPKSLPKSTSKSTDSFIPIKAASKSFYAPQVLWHQTKTQVFMEIQLKNVENYSALVLKKKIFIFKTKLNDKEYSLNFPLFNDVNKLEKFNTGLSIKVILTKVKEEEWEKLANTKEKMRNVKYDLNKIKEEETRKRRFLDHGFGPDEDEDYPLIYNLSSEESESDSEGCDDLREKSIVL